jgi:hypothetical protein
MNKIVQAPLAVDHLRALMEKIPGNMLSQTVSHNAYTRALYLRPTILASFLDRFSLPKMCHGIPGLRLSVSATDVICTVQGPHAIASLSRLNLPTNTPGAGRYEFEQGENYALVAHVSHSDLKILLQSIYGENLSYGYSIIAKLGEHLGMHRAALVDPTRIRIAEAYRKGQGTH